jgi:hypothetical protein
MQHHMVKRKESEASNRQKILTNFELGQSFSTVRKDVQNFQLTIYFTL